MTRRLSPPAGEVVQQPADERRAADERGDVDHDAVCQHRHDRKHGEGDIEAKHPRDDLGHAEAAVGGALIVMGAVRLPHALAVRPAGGSA